MAKPPLYSPGPAYKLVAISPNDSTDIEISRGFHANAAGDITFNDGAGNTVTMTILAGIPYPYAATRIWSTGTTATGIFAVY